MLDFVSLSKAPYIMNIKFCRSGDIEKHVVEPAAKNKFLSELEIDAAQLEQVRVVMACMYVNFILTSGSFR